MPPRCSSSLCSHCRPNRNCLQQLSRETKKQQRRTFRQLFATIGENEPPEEVVSLQNGSLTVADWAHIKQLNALRACLQSGFQVRGSSLCFASLRQQRLYLCEFLQPRRCLVLLL